MKHPQLTDRSTVFYWQTDRSISPEEAGAIWADRHGYFTDDEIITQANKELSDDPVVTLEPFKDEAQTNLGNVNSVRVGTLSSGKSVIIRCHPKGIDNGYFYAEALAAQQAVDHHIPSYRTLVIHDAVDDKDFAFQICEKLPGIAVKHWLEEHPQDETELLKEVGRAMAEIHKIKVKGFGPFDNQVAKNGQLAGLHQTYISALTASLDFNLTVLKEHAVVTNAQAEAIRNLYRYDSEFLQCDQPVLVHNDFADWNLLTDGKRITGVLDWDECVGGDPVSDIACWSTFFEPERLPQMLAGYWSVHPKATDFDGKFEILRLRYIVSKMTLRVRRYTWAPTDEVKKRIEVGKVHLAESLKKVGIK